MAPRLPNLPGFQKEPRELVWAMVDAGWTGRMTSKGHWMGKAPDGTTATVQSKVGDRRGLKNARANFARWLRANMTPEELAALEGALDSGNEVIQDVVLSGVARKQVRRLSAAATEADLEKRLSAVVKAVEKELDQEILPTVRPWLAKSHSATKGGVRYESQAVLERIWPDGAVDYACPMCTFVSGKPRSVSNHYGMAHTRQGESEPAEQGPQHLDPSYTEPGSHRAYRPTERLVAALSEFLSGVVGFNTLDPAEMAQVFLTWANERPDIDHTERPAVPLTDKQILDRIRFLVGQPDQSEYIARLEEELVVAKRAVDRLRDEKVALRELLKED